MYKVSALILLLITLSYGDQLCTSEQYIYDASKGDANPLRGFFSYQAELHNRFPSSMEYTYIAMKNLMNGPNSYTWNSLDNILNAVAGRNRQLIFRIFLDYPNNENGVPSFLLTNCGSECVTMTNYTLDYGSGQSPDYTNNALISAIERLITELGNRYDGDRRIAFIQVGFLGFWGEWHTYPRTEFLDGSSSVIRQTMSRVLNAFNSSFSITHIAVSADQLMYTQPDLRNGFRIGWHDDDFGSSTCTQTWGFKTRMQNRPGALDKSNTVAFGGEVQPSVQNTVFSSDSEATTIERCINDTRVSWLLYYNLFQSSFNTNHRNRALATVRKMGYQFHLSQARVITPTSCTTSISGHNRCALLSIDVVNRGNAPFYYNAFISIKMGQNQFNSSQSLKGLLSTGSFDIPISWIHNSGTINVNISIVSNHVPLSRPISWSVSTVSNAGSVSLNFPNTCGYVISSTTGSIASGTSGSSSSGGGTSSSSSATSTTGITSGSGSNGGTTSSSSATGVTVTTSGSNSSGGGTTTSSSATSMTGSASTTGVPTNSTNTSAESSGAFNSINDNSDDTFIGSTTSIIIASAIGLVIIASVIVIIVVITKRKHNSGWI